MTTSTKIFVFTNDSGRVVGTYQPPREPAPDAPVFRPSGQQPAGHHIHELDLPAHLQNVASADELHRQLADILRARRS